MGWSCLSTAGRPQVASKTTEKGGYRANYSYTRADENLWIQMRIGGNRTEETIIQGSEERDQEPQEGRGENEASVSTANVQVTSRETRRRARLEGCPRAAVPHMSRYWTLGFSVPLTAAPNGDRRT